MRYKFKLENDFMYESGIKNLQITNFAGTKGKLWISINKEGDIAIRHSYAWDGCSLKYSVLDLFWVGTPDGIVDIKTGKPMTYYASMVHDALYQMLRKGVCPYSRKQADQIFLKIMKGCKFKLRYVYYIAVRLFGWTGILKAKIKRKLSIKPQVKIL